jgi:hypothetical protein
LAGLPAAGFLGAVLMRNILNTDNKTLFLGSCCENPAKTPYLNHIGAFFEKKRGNY